MKFEPMKIISSNWARAKNMSLYFLASLLHLVFGLLLSPILSVNLNHRDFAIIGYFNSFNSLFTPLIGFTFASYYSKTFFKISAERRTVLRETMVTAQLFLGFISLMAILGLFYVYSLIYDVGFPYFPHAIVCYSSILFSNLYSFYLLHLRLSKDAGGFFRFSAIHHILYFITMILLCVIIKWGAIGSLTATLFVSLGMGLFCVHKLTRRLNIDKVVLIDALKFCWPLILAGIVHYFTSGIDRAMLAGFKDDHNLGLYNVAFRVTGYTLLFFQVITMTVEPDLYQAIAQKRYKRLMSIILSLLVANTVIVVVFIVFVPFVLNLLTMGRYNEAASLARILSLKNITSSLFFISAIIINALGYSKVTLVNRVIAAVLIFIMFRYLINNYGFVGAAWGQVFSYFILTLFSTIFVIFKYYSRKRELLRSKRI